MEWTRSSFYIVESSRDSLVDSWLDHHHHLTIIKLIEMRTLARYRCLFLSFLRWVQTSTQLEPRLDSIEVEVQHKTFLSSFFVIHECYFLHHDDACRYTNWQSHFFQKTFSIRIQVQFILRWLFHFFHFFPSKAKYQFNSLNTNDNDLFLLAEFVIKITYFPMSFDILLKGIFY